MLLTNLPVETYQLAKDLVAPAQLKDDGITYDSIVERMQKQLKPERSVLIARYEFDNWARNSGESVSHYVATLKHLEEQQRMEEFEKQLEVKRKLELAWDLAERLKFKHQKQQSLKHKMKIMTLKLCLINCLILPMNLWSLNIQMLWRDTYP